MEYYILTDGRTQRFYRRTRSPHQHRLARGTCSTLNQQHSSRFIVPSGANSAITSSSATNMPSRTRSGNVATYYFKTSHRVSSDPSSYRPHIIRFLNDHGPIKIYLRPAHPTSSRNVNYRSACLQHHKTRILARGVLPHQHASPLAPTAAFD